MFSEPLRSPYDWEFYILGFPVRITWTFWVFSAVFGYEWARGLDKLYFDVGFFTPGPGILLAIWVAVSFVSILVHEFGHSIAMKYFGIDSYIVLYHMGGLAVPTGASGFRRSRLSHGKQMIISVAGPAAQLLLGGLVAVIAFAIGHPMGDLEWILPSIGIQTPTSEPFTNAVWTGLIDAAIFTSIFWALLNLLPVLPLDGGRIVQNAIGWYRRTSGLEEATNLSILVCIIIVFGAFRSHQSTLAIYFIVIGIINLQSLQSDSHRY